jgi:hypothetical protein
MDLADLAERLQVSGQFGTPDPDPDTIVSLGKGANHMPPKEARASENRDEGVRIRCHGLILKGAGIRSETGIFRRYAARQPAGRPEPEGFLTRFLDANRCRVKLEDILRSKMRQPAIRTPFQGFDKRAADAY